jgi:glycosyltransferase involved in cell wall biosynthesis
MNNLLGIAIPTYRRPGQLRQCLESVIRSAGVHEVPVCVIDDSGDMTNSEVRSWFLSAYPGAHWITNTSNKGIDGNILNAVDLCDSEYVWLLGEDDRLRADAVPYVLRVMDQCGDVPFVFVNYASVDGDIKVELKPRAVNLISDQLVSSEIFASEYVWASGFIGACIIKKDRWRAVRTERYTGSYFAHVGHILEMAKSREVLMIAESLVLNRCGEPGLFTWTSNMFNVVYGWGRMINLLPSDMFEPSIKGQMIDVFEASHGIGSLKFLLYARADRAYDPKIYRDYMAERMPKGVKKMMAWMIARFPAFPLRLCRFTLTRIRAFFLPVPKMVNTT